MNWIGPFKIEDLLENCLDNNFQKPPVSDSVYLITEKNWQGQPSKESMPLYTGSNTGNSARFRIRIGDLIADLFGFYVDKKGHHSGGISLHKYCQKKNTHPKNLFIAWLAKCECQRCFENKIYEKLKPILNKKRPSRCKGHLDSKQREIWKIN